MERIYFMNRGEWNGVGRYKREGKGREGEHFINGLGIGVADSGMTDDGTMDDG